MLKWLLSVFRKNKSNSRPARRFNDFYQAWHFLTHHPMFDDTPRDIREGLNTDLRTYGAFKTCLDTDVVKVNPVDNRINDDPKLNTATRIWLECGRWMMPHELSDYYDREYFPQGVACNDWGLMCGGDTFEEAIVNLANKVYERYDDLIWPWDNENDPGWEEDGSSWQFKKQRDVMTMHRCLNFGRF